MADWRLTREEVTLAIDGLGMDIEQAETRNDFYNAVESLAHFLTSKCEGWEPDDEDEDG